MSAPTSNLERIAKLLNQAENTSGPESEAFMEAAQRLAATYSIDLNKARMSTAEKEKYSTPTSKFLQVGEHGKKGLRTLQALAAGIAEANDLQVTYRNNGTGITMYGFPEDIAVTEAMYASLVTQMVSASEKYLATGEYKKDTVWSESAWAYKPMSKITARLNFQQSFADRIETRLWRARREAIQEKELQEHLERITENGSLSEEFKIWYFLTYGIDLDQDSERRETLLSGAGKQDGKRFVEELADAPEGPSTELVLADKRQQVSEFYAANSNARGTWKGYGNSGGRASEAGYQAGSNARLGGQGSLPGARKALQ